MRFNSKITKSVFLPLYLNSSSYFLSRSNSPHSLRTITTPSRTCHSFPKINIERLDSLNESEYAAGMSHDATPTAVSAAPPDLRYIRYDGAREDEYVAAMRQLISKDLSEPYSIYVYRYFLYQWGDLCFMAMDDTLPDPMVGVVVSKLEPHRGGPLRGYIAMLAVREEHRGRGIATKLVRMAIDAMIARDADEIALETEITNTAAIKLYERLGFLRSKRLHRYYLNGNSAYRLVLYLKEGVGSMRTAFDPYGPPDMSGPIAPPPPALLHGNGNQ